MSVWRKVFAVSGEGKKALRNVIGSLPVADMLNTALNVNYAWARRREDYIEQLACHPKFPYLERSELDDLHYKAIKQAFIHHYNDCKFYHEYCKKNGNVKPNDIHNIEDVIKKIPQIPAETFKQGGILSIPKWQVSSVVTTSGTTSNTPSYLPRDNKSFLRFGKSAVRMILGPWWTVTADGQSTRNRREIEKYFCGSFYLGLFMPTPAESSTWMTQVMKAILPLFNLLGFEYDFFLEGFEFDEEKIFNTLKRRREESEDVWMLMFGFHYVLNRLMNYMEETGKRLKLDSDGEKIALTFIGGGWKKLTGEAIDQKDFEKKLVKYFGISDKWIIDFYGLGECNIAAIDFCPTHIKHFIPNARFVVRDQKHWSRAPKERRDY